MGRRNRRRTSPEQRLRRRRRLVDDLVWAPLRLLALTALGLGIGFGAYWVAIYLRTASALEIRCIEVNGTSRLGLEELKRTAGLTEGQNIFAVELDRAEKRLRAHAWVRTAQVQRVVPDRIVVEIEEHRPAALVSLDGLYLVDEQGEVFKRLQPGEQADLPVITGISRAAFTEAPERARTQMRAALQAIDQVSETACLKRRELAEVHLDELLGTSLVLDPGALQVRLGPDQLDDRLGLLCRLFDELDRRGLKARSVLLDRSDRPHWVTVRLESVAAAANGNQKTSRNEHS